MSKPSKKLKKNHAPTISEFSDIRNKKIPSRDLYRYAEKYIDFGELFEKGKPKVSELTEYKTRKIRKALNELIGYAGGKHYLERDFIPVKKSALREQYNEQIGHPTYTRGVFISGGEKVNGRIVIDKKLHLNYRRGEYDYTSAPLDARTEKTLVKSITKHRKKIESSDATYIGSNGNFIYPSYKEGHTPTDAIIEKTLFLKNKYDGMAARGEKRSNGRTAAKMSKWGISLLWSAKHGE